MAEYIEREAAIKVLDEYIIDHPLFTDRDAARAVKAKLDTIPAADVAPARHGRWISDGHGKRFGTVVRLDKNGCPVDTCHCSECGEWLTASDEYPVIGYYCPNCGARMDGEE